MAETSFRESLRGDIVARAAAITAAEGLAGVQARRIAREAGCAVGTIYNVFGDIDGLIIAVNASTLAMLGEAVRVAGSDIDGLPLEQRLSRLALAYVHFALLHTRRWEAVFKHRVMDGREVPASYLEDQTRLLALIEAALGDSIPDANLRAATARALFGAVHGIVALALDNRLGGRLKSELDDQVRRIVSLAARGIEQEQTPSAAPAVG